MRIARQLAALHGVALSIRIVSTLNGSTRQDAAPAIASLFGFIYFESIVFALGTVVFVLALIKERNEAASMAMARTGASIGIANRAGLLASAERALERCCRVGTPSRW